MEEVRENRKRKFLQDESTRREREESSESEKRPGQETR